MALIDWTPELSVGVNDMDAQHQKLVDMVNELHGAMRQGKGAQSVAAMLQRLKEYVQHHFAAEEKLMEKAGFPGLAAHKAEHIQLIEKVLDFELAIQDGGAVSSAELMRFLKSWLVDHIKGSDQEYGQHLNAA